MHWPSTDSAEQERLQLALKFAEDHKDEYNPILWINSKDEETLRSSFARCASQLQLAGDRTFTQGSALTDSAAIQAVLRWLQERKESDDKWLVVIDNADDISWGVKNVIPKGIQGSIYYHQSR